MRTGAEPFAGAIAWAAFPVIPRVPPIFPFETGKHRAGVAELVDALVLGTSWLFLVKQGNSCFNALDCGGFCAVPLKHEIDHG